MELLRRIPFEAVARLALLGGAERLSAQQAKDIGLVSEVVPADRLIVQPASQITEAFDWWPVAERLAARLGEPLLASGVTRPGRRSRVTPARDKPAHEEQLAMDLDR